MKTVLVLLIALLLTGNHALSQESRVITIKAGSDFVESVMKVMYRYPAFMAGRVVFKDGTASASALNYNLLNGEVQFIDGNRDTLAIANEKTIDYVLIGKDSFFYDKGYVELVASNPEVKLGMRQRLKFLDKQKIGAYGLPSVAGSVDSYNSYTDGRSLARLDVKEDIRLNRKTEYFLGDRFNHYLTVNKRNLYRMFSKHEDEISSYLKTHDVDFSDETDMKALAGFLQELILN